MWIYTQEQANKERLLVNLDAHSFITLFRHRGDEEEYQVIVHSGKSLPAGPQMVKLIETDIHVLAICTNKEEADTILKAIFNALDNGKSALDLNVGVEESKKAFTGKVA